MGFCGGLKDVDSNIVAKTALTGADETFEAADC